MLYNANILAHLYQGHRELESTAPQISSRNSREFLRFCQKCHFL